MDALRLAGLTVKSVIVWDKKAHGMGDLKGSFAPRYEVIIFAAKGRFELPGKRPDDLIAVSYTHLSASSALYPSRWFASSSPVAPRWSSL